MKHSSENNLYIAVIGDIVASKALSDRAATQEKLSRALDKINAAYANDIAAKFMITLGDEFQGLLHSGMHTVDIAEQIERAMYPVRVRFGIGVGPMTTAIDPDRPLGADGPAYYHAREAVDMLKASEHKRMEPRSDIWIGIEGDPDITEALNAIFALNAALKSRWAERQREVVSVYLDDGGTQSQIAAQLGVHQSTVQKALAQANFYAYLKALRTVSGILSQIGRETNV